MATSTTSVITTHSMIMTPDAPFQPRSALAAVASSTDMLLLADTLKGPMTKAGSLMSEAAALPGLEGARLVWMDCIVLTWPHLAAFMALVPAADFDIAGVDACACTMQPCR